MMKLMRIWPVLLLLSVPVLGVAVDEEKLADPEKEQIARTLMKEVRCLVCQNQSIEDSNADLARDLRIIIREQIGAGKTPEEVKTFLVDRYGDWVLLKPPFNGGTLLLWGSPLLFLLVVGIAIAVRRKANGGPSALSPDEKAQLDALLDDREEQK